MKVIFKQFFCTKKGEHPPVLDGVFVYSELFGDNITP
jgi:hypothetical protein